MVSSLWAMVVISMPFLALRLFCKGKSRSGFTLDDHFIAIAWICNAIYAAFITASVRYGLGRHVAEVSPSQFVTALKLLLVGEEFATVSLSISKTSFALTLLRLTIVRWQKYLLWFIVVSVNLAFGTCAFVIFFWCSPPSKSWDSSIPGTCWNPRVQSSIAIFVGSYSAFADFLLAGIAWVMIWNLRINKKEKVGVAIAMSLGFLAGIGAAIKTSYILDIAQWKDFSFSCFTFLIWTSAEAALTVVATSIPYLRHLVNDIINKSKEPCGDSESGDSTGGQTKEA